MIQGVEFLEDSTKSDPSCIEFSLENLRDPQRIATLKKPVVYLVRHSDLHAIRACGDAVIDRGIKDRRKELSKYLLGLKRKGIPLIHCDYKSTRQITRSIRNFISRSRECGERNLNIIGVQDEFFNELWGAVDKDCNPTASSNQPSTMIKSSSYQAYSDKYHINLLNLIKHHEVPKNLDENFVGRSLEIQLVKQMILCAAEVNNSVLIIGGTGTGKDVVAREIHRYSSKRGHIYVPVNCGAIPGELFEAELFGYVRGAFTGAIRDKVGKWKHAGNGTLFLDEIGDLHADHQAKILRVLEDKKITPLGALNPETVNARIITATNRDLFSMFRQGQFREDLFYRLCGMIIRTPSLRDIPSDIPLIAQKKWKDVTNDKNATLPDEIIDELMHYHWPGNVRELKVVLGQMLALFGKDNLNAQHVRTVFSLLGQTPKDIDLQEREKSILQIAKALNHLKSVSETIHALKSHFHTSPENGKSDMASLLDSLRFHVNDLEFLCREPSLFGEKETFLAVHHLQGQFYYLLDSLQKDAEEPISDLKDTIKEGIIQVLFKVSHTIDVLKDKA